MTYNTIILPFFLLFPFFGGVICWQCERFGKNVPRWIALITIGTIFTFSLKIWFHIVLSKFFNIHNIPNFQEELLIQWIPRFGITIHLAIDGLSLIMVTFTLMLGVLSILCSWSEIKKYHGLFHLNILWILSAVMGVFLSRDMFLFFFFWEMMLVPMYFLIALWGHKQSYGPTRITAANQFFIYTQASGFLMLISIISLVFLSYKETGVWTFNYENLMNTPMTPHTEYLLMLGFFLAFSVKMPVVPFHGWLPDAQSHAPTAGSVDLSGIIIKTAAYSFLRFILPIFPSASHDFSPIAMLLGVLGIFYGALLACSQNDIKKFISYTSISHMGFLLISIYSGSKLAYQGAVIQMITHGITAAGMFIICGQLYERLHTRNIRNMGGVWGRIQYMPAFYLFFVIASIGIPGTGNFVGEFMILLGMFQTVPVITILSTFGLILSSVYALMMMQLSYYGTPKSEHTLPGMTSREFFIIFFLVFLLVQLGIYPKIILENSNTEMNHIQHWFSYNF